ncbi:MAG: hypothetical protein JW910_09980 [Anaerolineae bacterium]|nr:hypothetical protein [Anaerolineae bacterium]
MQKRIALTAALRLVLAGVMVLLLAACDAPAQDGVALEVVPTLPTPPPVPVSRALIEHPQVTVSLRYPPGWHIATTDTSLVAYADGPANLPQIGARLYYTHSETNQLIEGTPGGFVRTRLLWEPIGENGIHGRFDAELQQDDNPLLAVPYEFTWGGYHAVVLRYTFYHEAAGLAVDKVQIALQIERRGGFLVLWSAVPVDQWDGLEPTILASLASLTLQGAGLSEEMLRAALAAFAAGDFLTPAAEDAGAS